MKLPIGKLPLGKLPLGKLSRKRDSGAAKTPVSAPAAKGATLAAVRKVPLNRATLAVGTGVAVFAIGFAMQNFTSPPAREKPAPAQPGATMDKAETGGNAADLPRGVAVKAVTPTSADAIPQDAPVPALPQERIATPPADAAGEIALARLQDAATPMPFTAGLAGSQAPVLAALGGVEETPAAPAESVPVLPCDIGMTADPAAAAMVDLHIDASCLPDERFTLHHNGMMFHVLTDGDGRATLRVPALSENAVFIASFDTGDGAVAQIDVPTLAFYDRAVVQWRGDAGLGLHALEFGATYFSKGHIHTDAPGEMAAAASGTSGFLTRFGQETGPEALMAEVYTFPTGTSGHAGNIRLSVEAEVTADNCGKEVEAQTLQLTPGAALRSQDLTLYMPDCDGSGDFLVLNNLLEPMKVAAK